MVDEVRRVIDLLEDFTERFIIEISTNITSRLFQTTPVDTGWARVNWVPSIGVSVDVTTGSPEAVSRGDQIAGLGRLLSYQLSQGKVFITNNVPYIVRLNEGSSAQAPAGFIQSAIDSELSRSRRG